MLTTQEHISQSCCQLEPSGCNDPLTEQLLKQSHFSTFCNLSSVSNSYRIIFNF